MSYSVSTSSIVLQSTYYFCHIAPALGANQIMRDAEPLVGAGMAVNNPPADNNIQVAAVVAAEGSVSLWHLRD